jgi:hypothetical protein
VLLRAEAGRDPHDRDLTDLIGQLATRSESFRTRWPRMTAGRCTRASRLHHPIVGELALSFEALDLQADPGVTVVTFSAEPGSTSEEALRLLGSWAATTAAEQQSLAR